MTVQVDILTLGFLVVAIILVSFLLPMIWQVKKTAQEAGALFSELRNGLPPAVKDLNETMERINRITGKVEKGTNKAEDMVETLDELAESLRHASSFLRQDMYRYAEIAGGLLVGIKAASKVLFQKTDEEEKSL
jgi:uncharacterized protein YoxC